MRDTPLHPQKQVLVEHVSDDIRELRKRNAEQQKTILTGRAIADIFAGDSFVASRVTDKPYLEHRVQSSFSGSEDMTLIENQNVYATVITDKVDLDRLVDASIRYVQTDQYINGPLDTKFGGFIYVAADLPSGTLTWDSEMAATRGDHFSVRQILYPDSIEDFESFTRVGRYITVMDATNTTVLGHKWVWTKWVPVSGRLFRILVTNATSGLLTASNLRTNVIYELHLGGQLITLPDANTCLTGTSLVFEQYPNTRHTYTLAHSVGDSGVPNAKTRYFLKVDTTLADSSIKTTYEPAGTNGWIETFADDKDYYIRNSREAWVNTIEYTDTILADNGDATVRKYTTQTEAALDTLRTADKSLDAGAWFDESESAVQYRFEVVDNEEPIVHNDGTVSTRTWMIDVDAEALDRTADMVALLDSHTDLMLTDIVQYGARLFKDSAEGANDGNLPPGLDDATKAVLCKVNEPLVVSRSVSMAGLMKFVITANNPSALTANFKIEIFKFNENDDAFNQNTTFNFTPVSAGTTPSIYETYYTFDSANGVYKPAGTDGHLDTFATGVTYYKRTVNYTTALETAKFVYSATGVDSNENASFLANDGSTFGRNNPGYFSSNTTLKGYIKCNRNDTIMVVISSSNHVTDLEKVSPVVEFYPDPHDSYVSKPYVADRETITQEDLNKLQKPGTSSEEIASAESVVNAYETIVSTLQKQGLMFGSVPTAENSSASTDLNMIKTQGIYTLNSSSLSGSDSHLPSGYYSTYADASVAGSNATLFVTVSSTCDKTGVYRESKVVDKSISGYKRITQILMSNIYSKSSPTSVRIWVRYGIEIGTNTSWSNWSSLRSNPETIEATISSGAVSEASMIEYLARGEPNVVLKGKGEMVTVNLPDPANYKDVKFQIEAKNAQVTIQYTKGSTTYTFTNATTRGETNNDRMLYPIESDGELWYVITVS